MSAGLICLFLLASISAGCGEVLEVHAADSTQASWTLTHVTSNRQPFGEEDCARLVVLPSPVQLRGHYRVKSEQSPGGGDPVRLHETVDGIHVSGWEFQATSIADEAYWVDRAELDSVLENQGRSLSVELADLTGPVTLVVDLCADSRVGFGFANVGEGMFGIPASSEERDEARRTIRRRSYAVEHDHEDPVRLIVERRVPDAPPGSFELSFDDFIEPDVATLMTVQVIQPSEARVVAEVFDDGRVRLRPGLVR